jgi:hypothetical protein
VSNPSYYARVLLSGDDTFAIEQPPTAITGHPYFELPVALGVFNRKGSGKKVKVKLFNTRAMTTAQSLVAVLNVQRITAASDPSFGPDVGTVTPFKLDSANADLPSQVQCLYAPRSVTVVANSQYRRVMVQPQLNFARVLGYLIAQGQGDARSGNDSGEFYADRDADTQMIVLNAGEGIAFDYVGSNAMAIHAYSITMVVRNPATNETYRFSRVIEPRIADSGAVLSLMNGAGSGVVLHIKRIQIREVGTDEEPQVSYEAIEYLDEGAAMPDMSPMDSADPLASGIIVRTNANAVRAGAKFGGLISIPAMRRIQLTESPWFAGSTGLGGLTRRGKYVPDMQFGTESAIVLSEGQGIGIRKINPSARCSHEVQLLFEVEDVGAGGTYPAVGDVDSGVTYGPTGADFTGTLQQPAISDVRSGVSYGAGGTEFTGTYAGGGGGNTYSKSRVVNKG